MANTFTVKQLLQTDKIVSFSPEAHLSQALAALTSSHDAAFVVDEKNILLGVVNPFYTLFQSRFPPESKLSHCSFMPPKLALTDGVAKIVKNMLESKLYYLPVCNGKNQLVGIVSTKGLLRKVLADERLAAQLKEYLTPRMVTTITPEMPIDKARSLLSKSGVSRLPVVDREGRLCGIITRFDIRQALSLPRRGVTIGSRAGEKKKALGVPIASFMTHEVQTADQMSAPGQLISVLLQNAVGSVVLVDRGRRPTGLLTYRDLLQALQKLFEGSRFKWIIKTDEQFAPRLQIKRVLAPALSKWDKRSPLMRVRTVVAVNKNSAQTAGSYDVSVQVTLENGKSFYSEVNQAEWGLALKKILSKLEKQIYR